MSSRNLSNSDVVLSLKVEKFFFFKFERIWQGVFESINSFHDIFLGLQIFGIKSKFQHIMFFFPKTVP